MARIRRRRSRIGDACGSIALLLVIVAASVWVIVRNVTLWIGGHPEAVALAVLLMGLGGWGGPRVAARASRSPAPAPDTDFLALSPSEFEDAVAALCRRDGCRDVLAVGGAGDLAADVLATLPDGRRVLVQCKRYAAGSRVGSGDVQKVGGTYSLVHRADLAIVVTTSAFTAAAENYARTAGILLVNGQQLAAWAGGASTPWS